MALIVSQGQVSEIAAQPGGFMGGGGQWAWSVWVCRDKRFRRDSDGEEAGISDRHWDTGILAPSLMCSGL